MAEGEEDSPYDFADEPAPTKRTELPGKPQPPAIARPQPPAAEQATAAAGAIERSCPHCGFTFMGRPKARCPECAAPLDSSAADLLQFSDLAWVRTVALGTLLIVPAMALHITGAVVRWFDEPLLKGVFHAAGAILLAAAVFLATRKEPGKSLSGTAITGRLAAVIAMIIWIGLGLSAGKLLKFEGMGLRVTTTLALAFHVAFCIPLAIYFNRLAFRIPDDTLASHANITGWLCAVASAIMMVLKFTDVTGPDHLGIFMCSFPLILAFVVIFVWAMVTLLRLNLNFKAAINAGVAISHKRAERLAALRHKKK